MPRGWRGGVGACWWSGAPRAGVCRPGGCGAVRARRVLDSGSAGRAPANAGRGGGPGARGCHGESQGDTGKLLDVLVPALAVVWGQVGVGVACHAMAALGLGFRAWEVWGCVQNVQGECWEGAGHVG